MECVLHNTACLSCCSCHEHIGKPAQSSDSSFCMICRPYSLHPTSSWAQASCLDRPLLQHCPCLHHHPLLHHPGEAWETPQHSPFQTMFWIDEEHERFSLLLACHALLSWLPKNKFHFQSDEYPAQKCTKVSSESLLVVLTVYKAICSPTKLMHYHGD